MRFTGWDLQEQPEDRNRVVAVRWPILAVVLGQSSYL